MRVSSTGVMLRLAGCWKEVHLDGTTTLGQCIDRLERRYPELRTVSYDEFFLNGERLPRRDAQPVKGGDTLAIFTRSTDG